nr:hypothetical protein [Lachnospiraceae bacterium]
MKEKILTELKGSSVLKAVLGMENKVIRFMSAAKRVPGKAPEWMVVAVYALLHLLVGAVHEPWYDEAQAWQIARSASLWEIIFEIPHYEGHPQLWHILLYPFAKLGVPYELSLSLVTLVVAGSAVALLVFYAPFPRIVRWILPFTYFLFYQYGIVARPYCLMFLAFVLLAMTYQGRHEKPCKYTLCLFFLCLTSVYGIVIAGGLAFVWLLECIKEKKNIIWLAVLLVAALLLAATLVPRENTYAMYSLLKEEATNNFWYRLYYMLFISLPDVLITNVFYQYSFLNCMKFVWYDGIIGGLLGVVIHGLIFSYGNKKKTAATFFVPFVAFAVVTSFLYCTAHHIGISLLLFLFWWWISLEAPGQETSYRGVVLLGTAMLCVMIQWSAVAVINEVQTDFAVGRRAAEFIKEYHLDEYRMMTEWGVLHDDDGNLITSDTNMCYGACDVAPYFEHNLFFNFGEGEDSKNYVSHVIPTEAENESKYKKWREGGYPDVLLMNPELSLVWKPEELSYKDYVMVYFEKGEMPWKANVTYSMAVIYVRRDLVEKLGLEDKICK